MSRLSDKDFSFKCPMSWDAMDDSANGKFCSKCRKEVFDLTNCSVDEVHALQDKHGSICGSVRVTQAAMVALSLSAAACNQQERTTGTPLPIPPSSVTDKNTHGAATKPISPTNPPRLMGEVCPPPQKPEKEAPIKEADPFQPNQHWPRLMGKICPQPLLNEPDVPSGPVIDI